MSSTRSGSLRFRLAILSVLSPAVAIYIGIREIRKEKECQKYRCKWPFLSGWLIVGWLLRGSDRFPDQCGNCS